MKLNVSSIKTRLTKLRQYISELKKQRALDLPQFREDLTAQLAVERAFQAAIECCTDIANHLISVYRLTRPENQKDIFPILARAGYLDDDYAQAMSEMVQFRNRIVHLYWAVDVERLHHYLQTDIPLLERFEVFALQLIEVER